jgi:NADPH:quinone reductase-like Zn-dependent oxidoreductase
LELAREYGADHVLAQDRRPLSTVRELTDGIGVGAVIENVGSLKYRLDAAGNEERGKLVIVRYSPHWQALSCDSMGMHTTNGDPWLSIVNQTDLAGHRPRQRGLSSHW